MDNIVHESEHLEGVVAPPSSSWRSLSDEEGVYWARRCRGTVLSYSSVRLASLDQVPTARRLIRANDRIFCGGRDKLCADQSTWNLNFHL